MKRKVISFILFISVNYCVSQNIIVGLSRNVSCPNECIDVLFRYNPLCKLPTNPNGKAEPMIIWVSGIEQMLIKTYAEFYQNKKYTTGKGNLQKDTVYSFPVCFPNTINLGTYSISSPGFCSTSYLGGSEKFTISIVDCLILGFDNLDINKSEVIYFDLDGNRASKQANKVLIEFSNGKRKKVYFYE